MKPDSNDITYAKLQLEEARRRLDSVRDRITDIEKRRIIAAMDDEGLKKIQLGGDVEELPEEMEEIDVIKEETEEVVNFEGHIQNVIIDCQMSIELSVKSMFKAAGQQFEYSHGISLESGDTHSFNQKVPAEFPRGEDIIRSIFLTQFWEGFYTLAKYGAPNLNVGPSVIFEIEDGERALNDATFCVELAEEFIEFIEEEEIE